MFVAPWCSGYHYCTTSFNKAWTLVLRKLKSCSRHVGDSRWWGSMTMVPAGNKAKHLSSVNHTTKTIHHHHHHQRNPHEIHNFREYHNVPLLLPIIWHISSSGMGQKALMKAKKYQWKKIHAKISTIILTHMLCVLLCKWLSI